MKKYTCQDFENMSKRELVTKYLTRRARITGILASQELQSTAEGVGLPKVALLPYLAVITLVFAAVEVPVRTAQVLYYMSKSKERLVKECLETQKVLENFREYSISKVTLIKKIETTLLRIAYLRKDLDVNLVPRRLHNRDLNANTLLDANMLKNVQKEELFKIFYKLDAVLHAARADIPNNKMLKGSNSWPMTAAQTVEAKNYIKNALPAWAAAAQNWDREWQEKATAREVAQSRLVDAVRSIKNNNRTKPIEEDDVYYLLNKFTESIGETNFKEDAEMIFGVYLISLVNLMKTGNQNKNSLNERQAKSLEKAVLSDFSLKFGLPALESMSLAFEKVAEELELKNPIRKGVIKEFIIHNGLEIGSNERIKHILSGYAENFDAEYLCPITMEFMTEPVFLDAAPKSGEKKITYDRSSLQVWVEQKKTDPITRKQCKGELIPNQELESSILSFLQKIVDIGNSKLATDKLGSQVEADPEIYPQLEDKATSGRSKSALSASTKVRSRPF